MNVWIHLLHLYNIEFCLIFFLLCVSKWFALKSTPSVSFPPAAFPKECFRFMCMESAFFVENIRSHLEHWLAALWSSFSLRCYIKHKLDLITKRKPVRELAFSPSRWLNDGPAGTNVCDVVCGWESSKTSRSEISGSLHTTFQPRLFSFSLFSGFVTFVCSSVLRPLLARLVQLSIVSITSPMKLLKWWADASLWRLNSNARLRRDTQLVQSLQGKGSFGFSWKQKQNKRNVRSIKQKVFNASSQILLWMLWVHLRNVCFCTGHT